MARRGRVDRRSRVGLHPRQLQVAEQHGQRIAQLVGHDPQHLVLRLAGLAQAAVDVAQLAVQLGQARVVAALQHRLLAGALDLEDGAHVLRARSGLAPGRVPFQVAAAAQLLQRLLRLTGGLEALGQRGAHASFGARPALLGDDGGGAAGGGDRLVVAADRAEREREQAQAVGDPPAIAPFLVLAQRSLDEREGLLTGARPQLHGAELHAAVGRVDRGPGRLERLEGLAGARLRHVELAGVAGGDPDLQRGHSGAAGLARAPGQTQRRLGGLARQLLGPGGPVDARHLGVHVGRVRQAPGPLVDLERLAVVAQRAGEVAELRLQARGGRVARSGGPQVAHLLELHAARVERQHRVAHVAAVRVLERHAEARPELHTRIVGELTGLAVERFGVLGPSLFGGHVAQAQRGARHVVVPADLLEPGSARGELTTAVLELRPPEVEVRQHHRRLGLARAVLRGREQRARRGHVVLDLVGRPARGADRGQDEQRVADGGGGVGDGRAEGAGLVGQRGRPGRFGVDAGACQLTQQLDAAHAGGAGERGLEVA